MQIDIDELGEHFASLSDEDLLELKREDLTETAQGVYDLEISRRRLKKASTSKRMIQNTEAFFDKRDFSGEDEATDPDWHLTGVTACAIVDQPGANAMERVAKARTALQTAEVPCYLSKKRHPDESFDTIEILVPIGYAMHAASILDRDLFNDEFETYWRDHLGMLSNKDLSALDPEIFCAGLLDKLARMKNVYLQEMAKRGVKSIASPPTF